MMRSNVLFAALLLTLVACAKAQGDERLAVGVAGHAFDHLGAIGEQASACAASGATILYPTGVGGLGYSGLPVPADLEREAEKSRQYLKRARGEGIQLAIGYVCATSIVKLETFDKNWDADFRKQFKAPPGEWLQRDNDGKPLPSWYGGDYRPACMNNPDWRAYEKFVVEQQLRAGHDGIFFDNPTVHADGCYCDHCMKRFAAMFALPQTDPVALRAAAVGRGADFMRFRCTVAREFLAEMRAFARTIKPDALVTCNNSLNTPEAFFSQCRTYGYNIFEMSKAEDLVVVEDMANQPRVTADGRVIEYGPVYEMVHAISHGKPLVAVTIADGDYHTPPNLVRLAMAEAAAHGASYLSWPTWPENQRDRMAKAIRPQADLLRKHAALLNGAKRRADVTIILPFDRWVETPECKAMVLARALGRANVQFAVVCEEDRERVIGKVVADSASVANVLEQIEKPSVTLKAPPAVRAVVADRPDATVVHLLNLNVQRLSSFEDKVTPAQDVRVDVRVPFAAVERVEALTADEGASRGELTRESKREGDASVVTATVPRLDVATILLITPKRQ